MARRVLALRLRSAGPCFESFEFGAYQRETYADIYRLQGAESECNASVSERIVCPVRKHPEQRFMKIDAYPYPFPMQAEFRPESTAMLYIDFQTDFCGTENIDASGSIVVPGLSATRQGGNRRSYGHERLDEFTAAGTERR